jgi:hypothetical protein
MAVAAGGGVVCVGGSFTETIAVAGQTFIAVHGADAFVTCFAP